MTPFNYIAYKASNWRMMTDQTILSNGRGLFQDIIWGKSKENFHQQTFFPAPSSNVNRKNSMHLIFIWYTD
jgi:hypothetical protein